MADDQNNEHIALARDIFDMIKSSSYQNEELPGLKNDLVHELKEAFKIIHPKDSHVEAAYEVLDYSYPHGQSRQYMKSIVDDVIQKKLDIEALVIKGVMADKKALEIKEPQQAAYLEVVGQDFRSLYEENKPDLADHYRNEINNNLKKAAILATQIESLSGKKAKSDSGADKPGLLDRLIKWIRNNNDAGVGATLLDSAPNGEGRDVRKLVDALTEFNKRDVNSPTKDMDRAIGELQRPLTPAVAGKKESGIKQ